MGDAKKAAEYGLDALLKAGADKAQCLLTMSQKHEMNVDSGALSLLRTTFDTQVNLTAIKDGRRGQSRVNKSDPEAIDGAATEALAIAASSEPDEANDIAEYQPPKEFSAGSESPDLDKMHFRMKELIAMTKERYPKISLWQAILEFTLERNYFLNSNGVEFVSTEGVYRYSIVFSARDGDKVSSFNYSGFSARDLDKPVLECGTIATLFGQLEEQVTTTPLSGKFVGDVILTPDCVGDALAFLMASISDSALISGTSIYKDSLDRQVASPLLTIHSKPVSEEICDGYFFTSDGFEAQNSTIVDRGVLKSMLLSLYGSKKTGRPRAVNQGQAWVIEPGQTPLEDVVKSVERGILLTRFSGGRPSENGDFSGVAKNSYLIEDGQIKYPISESMISGNFADMLMNITAISRERANFGYALVPWIKASGVTVSGK